MTMKKPVIITVLGVVAVTALLAFAAGYAVAEAQTQTRTPERKRPSKRKRRQRKKRHANRLARDRFGVKGA
jgi:hypothetical protein